jgi:DNA-binding NarL/FixJ family response regulator
LSWEIARGGEAMPVGDVVTRRRARKPRLVNRQPDPQAIRVLLISRSPVAREQIAQQLREQPSVLIVGSSGNAEEWSALVTEVDPDVVLLHASSTEAQQILGAPLSLEIPLVAVLDRFEAEDVRSWSIQAVAAGVRGMLAANPTPAELVAAIHGAAAGLLTMSAELTEALLSGGLSSEATGDQFEEPDAPEHLTVREREVLEMMMEGLSNKEIAAELSVSTHTVKFHISSILGKLGASSRTEATTIGLRRGLITI